MTIEFVLFRSLIMDRASQEIKEFSRLPALLLLSSMQTIHGIRVISNQ